MKNQMAIDVLNQMRKDGLDPTPEDVIRLNALGLKCTNGRRASEYRALPRTAYLGRLVVREPSLGHGEWLDRFMASVSNDAASVFIVAAFALTRGVDELPPPEDVDACAKAVRAFAKKDLSHFTFPQIKSALDYALVGTDPAARERASGDDEELSDDKSVHVGILWQTVSIGLGLSVAEIRKMTAAEVTSVQEMAFARLGIDVAKQANVESIGRFNDEVAAIRKRLEEERCANG